jgi:hypothetical protein
MAGRKPFEMALGWLQHVFVSHAQSDVDHWVK